MFQLVIAALAFAYSLAQALRHAHRMRGGADPASAPSGRIFDSVADQVSCFALFLLCSHSLLANNYSTTCLDLLCNFSHSIWTSV
jgi:hypothetical protein